MGKLHTSTEEGVYYTLQDVAKILNVHPSTVKRHITNGKLKHYVVGRLTRVSKEDFDKFMEANKLCEQE